jgi:hypothetical protein
MILPRSDQVTKNYDARLATRITTSVDTRLRQLALLRRRRISHLLDDVLDAALPTSEDLAAQFARCTSPPSQPPQACSGEGCAVRDRVLAVIRCDAFQTIGIIGQPSIL